jgi:hypothetical protein
MTTKNIAVILGALIAGATATLGALNLSEPAAVECPVCPVCPPPTPVVPAELIVPAAFTP